MYLQLLHDGWSVHVDKLCRKDVDFVCLREGEALYVQVADSMADEATRERELAPLHRRAFAACFPVTRHATGAGQNGEEVAIWARIC